TSGALTRLLYEMDGIEDKPWLERLRDRWFQFIGKEAPKRTWHVLFMGSTNRPDVLDPALLRPGRFDQKINVDPPDKAGRREVIRGYLTKIKHDDTVDIEAIVEDTPHTTPAQIAAAITKDAVRIALFKGRDRIGQRDIDQALQEQFLGIEQPIEEMDPEQRRQVAYHEAGHAVAQHYLMPDQRIVRVSIVRRGGAYGYMLPVDRIEVYVEPLRRIAADIMVSMAGHVAVKLATGEYWTGAYGDNRQIRRGIWRLYTLGYFGPPVLSADGGAGVPPSAAPLIERFWRTLEEQTENLLRQHYDELEGIAQLLLEKSDLSHDDVMPLLGDNGWRPTGSIVGRREPAQLPAAVKLPLPAPGEAAEPEPVVSEPAPVTAAVVEPVPDVPARKRMIRPPRPEDLARRPAPEPEPAKAEKADEKKE
ncbi:MAG: AAA family ATPase, partial [Anaerolineales bacterium]|nr:AAA family ATPase [Anaerolineales bacterium]